MELQHKPKRFYQGFWSNKLGQKGLKVRKLGFIRSITWGAKGQNFALNAEKNRRTSPRFFGPSLHEKNKQPQVLNLILAIKKIRGKYSQGGGYVF